MTKRRQKYNKRTRKRIRQTKITRGQIKRTFKKTSRARGWLDKILGKPPTQINLDVLMQNFTDCDWNVKYNCNSLKTELMKRLTEMKKNEIKEIKKEIKDKYDKTLKQGNALSKGIYNMEAEQLARDLKNKSSKDQVKMVEAFKKQRETNIIEDK